MIDKTGATVVKKTWKAEKRALTVQHTFQDKIDSAIREYRTNYQAVASAYCGVIDNLLEVDYLKRDVILAHRDATVTADKRDKETKKRQAKAADKAASKGKTTLLTTTTTVQTTWIERRYFARSYSPRAPFRRDRSNPGTTTTKTGTTQDVL